MSPIAAFTSDRSFWERLGWGVLIALLAALGTLIFVVLMNIGLNLVWKSWLTQEDMLAFSGKWQIVVIMTAAGLIVGLLHHFTNAEEVNVFQAVQKGYLNPKSVPAALLISLVSLIGGFSVGPEVPSGMFAGGLGTWLSERRKMSDEMRESNVLSGVVSAYGGLFTSPFPNMKTFRSDVLASFSSGLFSIPRWDGPGEAEDEALAAAQKWLDSQPTIDAAEEDQPDADEDNG